MFRAANQADECNAIPTATSKKDTAFTESIFKENVSGRGGEEKNPTYCFSKELAIKLNPKRPDNNASVVIFGLWLLQKMPLKPYQYHPMVNGKRGCYASLRELEITYPWLEHNSIWTVLHRAAAKLKGDFIIDDNNEHAKQGKLHFWISPKLIKQYRFEAEKKRGLLAVMKQDVCEYGWMAALLISNLEWITDPTRNSEPLKDEAGNIFRQLSPTVLSARKISSDGTVKSPILLGSRKSITEALTLLKEANVFKEHPTENNYYTPVSGYVEPKQDVTKVNSDVTKVTTLVTEVNSCEQVLDCNLKEVNELQQISKTSYTNTDTNSNTKCVLEETSSLRSDVSLVSSNLSSNAKILNDLVSEDLSAFCQREAERPRLPFSLEDYAVYKVIDDEVISLSHYELDYEIITLDWRTSKPYSREAEIDYTIKDLRFDFRCCNFAFTYKDITKLRQLFIQHPDLNYDNFRELFIFIIGGDCLTARRQPKKGFDFFYWSRRIHSLHSMLQYLPHLIREWHVDEKIDYYEVDVETNMPMFDYSDMPEPFLSMAFTKETKIPVKYKTVLIEHKEEKQTWQYHFAKKHLGYTYFPEYECTTEIQHQPLYYNSFMHIDKKEYVEHDRNPIALL